jgi:hypothetical protein
MPISQVTFDWLTEPVLFLAAASIGSCLIVTATLLRLYLGWSFVGNRLLSATIEYEGVYLFNLQGHMQNTSFTGQCCDGQRNLIYNLSLGEVLFVLPR